MSERPEIFQGVSSLADDFDATIDGAWFGKNPRYVFDGKMPTVLQFKLISDELEDPEEMLLSIGDGWVPVDNKSRVELEKPRSNGKIGFGDSSNIMKWIDRMFELDEAAVMARYEETGAGPDDVRFWDGMKAHFNREQTAAQKANNKSGNLIPTALHGWDVAEKAAAPAPAKKTAKKKAAAKPKADTNGAGEIDPAVLQRINDIADASETHDEFISTVFSEVEEAAEEPLYSKVMEGEDVEGSIWAEAFARAAE